MQAYELTEIVRQRAESGQPWLEFLRVPTLSMGLYELAAGATDPQLPHTEDEVYYVVSGQGMIDVAGESQTVGPGSIVFVAATVPHRFHTIMEDLRVLVFFAPAEGSQVLEQGHD
jgi:mannose-6-phosphate isomerase-like protein (cupin superfamily)